MTNIVFVLALINGVTLRIPAQWESKHYSADDCDAAGELLAKQLGATLLYWETV